MADFKISKKHHPSGSLSRRILLISILLLVIPLFLQTLFLYRQEYEQKLGDVKSTLTILAQERAHWIKEMIQMNWVLLDRVPENFSQTEAVSGDPHQSVKQQYITPKTAPVFGDPNQNVKRLYRGAYQIEKIPLPQGVADHFVLVSKNRDALLVGKKISDTTALIIPLEFPLFSPKTASICLSFSNSRGKVLWESVKFKNFSDVIAVNAQIPQTDLTLELSVEKQHIHGLQIADYSFRFATFLFFVGGIGGTAVYLFTRRIGKPLKDLCKTMQRVSEGASHARYTPDWMGFEINALGKQFNETLDALLDHIRQIEKERLKREKLAEELRIGHEIQAGLVALRTFDLPEIDLAASYFAAKEVNGDFYDVFPLEGGKILIAICDTAGKGVSACLFSLGLRSMIRSLATVVHELPDLVRRINDLYWIDAHETSMFSTLWLGLYDPKSRELEYCTQGHPPALLCRNETLQELWTAGIPLGAQKIDVVSTGSLSLLKGDLLVLYTDGIPEAHDCDNQLFGKDRLHEFILRKKNESAQQIADQLIEEVHLFSHGAPQYDDITLLVMRFFN